MGAAQADAGADTRRQHFPSLRVLNKTQPVRYAVTLRKDTAPMLLALLNCGLGEPDDIIHAALLAVWMATKKTAPPKQRIKARRVRGGALVSLVDLLPEAGKKVEAKLKP